MNFAELAGKQFAVAAIGLNDKGEKEGAVFTGIARWANGHLYMDRGEGQKPFEIPDEALNRVKQVPEEIKDILLYAEYYIMMSIGPLPSDAHLEDYVETGLKWPE